MMIAVPYLWERDTLVGTVELKLPDQAIPDALEVVFQICNGGDPQSDVMYYSRGPFRSLSVGDVVELDGVRWLCESFGWLELPS